MQKAGYLHSRKGYYYHWTVAQFATITPHELPESKLALIHHWSTHISRSADSIPKAPRVQLSRRYYNNSELPIGFVPARWATNKPFLLVTCTCKRCALETAAACHTTSPTPCVMQASAFIRDALISSTASRYQANSSSSCHGRNICDTSSAARYELQVRAATARRNGIMMNEIWGQSSDSSESHTLSSSLLC